MKAVIEIDLKEIWSEEENFSEAMLSEIRHRVKNDIWSTIKDQVRTEITTAVALEVQGQVRSAISKNIDDYLETGVLNPLSATPETIKDYLHGIISNTRAWSSMADNLRAVAERYAKDVQQKYDVLFATNIVMKLKDHGMLDQSKLEQLFGEKS